MMEKFTGKNKNNEDVVYYVRKPRSVDITEAKRYANIVAVTMLNAKTLDGKPAFILAEQVSEYAKQLNLWSDEDEKKEKELAKEVADLEKAIHKGGVSKAKGKEIAFKLIEKRAELANHRNKLSSLESQTYESKIEDAQLTRLITLCILDEKEEPVFASVEDYEGRLDEEPWYIEAVQQFYKMYYGDYDKILNEQTEYKFLIKYKFINEKRQLIDKDGHLVNLDGQRINEKGYLLNEEGHPVNRFGIKVDENGNPIEPDMEFTDE